MARPRGTGGCGHCRFLRIVGQTQPVDLESLGQRGEAGPSRAEARRNSSVQRDVEPKFQPRLKKLLVADGFQVRESQLSLKGWLLAGLTPSGDGQTPESRQH